MKKLFLFLTAVILIGLTACNNKLTPEIAEKAVMKGEQEKLPLILQTLSFVDDITIDSIHLLITDEPMQGYLYTTWKSGKNERTMLVQVDSICTDKTRKDYIQWKSAWDDAARSYLMKSFGF